jgi:6-phosphogluconolactonase (cycloisomerase 2 family)
MDQQGDVGGYVTMMERARRLVAGMVAATLPVLTGCTGFFPPVDTGGGGGGATGNYAYVANAGTGSVSGFSIGTGTLTAVANSPLSLGYAPLALVVTPANNFLYVAGPTSINVYLIASNGAISVPTNGSTAAVATVVSLDVSPDGNWLFGLDRSQQVLDVYQINTSTGALAAFARTPYSTTSGTWVPQVVRTSPDGTLVFAALGTAGDVVFTFNTLTGDTALSQNLNLTTATSDNGLTVDKTTSYLYIARSGVGPGVAVYKIGSGGQLNAVTGSPFTAGTQTFSVVLDKTGSYAYAANRADSTISGFTIATGPVLTALKASPYLSGSLVNSLGADSTGKYLLATAFGGSADLTMYSFDTTTPGVLDKVASVSTDTSPAQAVGVALTH